MEKQLIFKEDGTITAEERNFISCHNAIVYYARSAYEFAYKMASEIKRMRDEKLYVAGGYGSFAEYTENVLGMKERNAYNYIQIVEKYSEEYLQLNAKLGVTKLLLLSSLSDADRAKIEEEAEGASVKELKEMVAAVKKEQGEQLSLLAKEKDAEIDKIKTETRKKIGELSDKVRRATLEKTELEKKLNDLKNTPPAVKTVDEPVLKQRIEDLEEKLRQSSVAEQTLKKQLEIAKDSNMTKFAVKFEDLQKVLGEIKVLLNTLSADNKERCLKALQSVLGGVVK